MSFGSLIYKFMPCCVHWRQASIFLIDEVYKMNARDQEGSQYSQVLMTFLYKCIFFLFSFTYRDTLRPDIVINACCLS